MEEATNSVTVPSAGSVPPAGSPAVQPVAAQPAAGLPSDLAAGWTPAPPNAAHARTPVATTNVSAAEASAPAGLPAVSAAAAPQGMEPMRGLGPETPPQPVTPADENEDIFGSISSIQLHIQALNSRQIASKWLKTSVLRQDPRVARHIPDTRIFSVQTLASMLDAYGKVVLKPVVGSGGLGLIMISRSGGHYSLRYQQTNRRFSSFSALSQAVQRVKRKRRYLIQRGINLATIDGRPVDYRVKMVKERRGWKTTAIVGRLARHGLFVTNLCRGGTQLKSSEAIRRSFSAAAVKQKKGEMRQVTRMSLALLERAFPGVGQLGFDYGFDRNGNLWIFEVNTRPH